MRAASRCRRRHERSADRRRNLTPRPRGRARRRRPARRPGAARQPALPHARSSAPTAARSARRASEIIIANAYFVPGVRAAARRCSRRPRRGVQGARCCCRAATSTSCSTTPAGRCTARCCAPASRSIEYAPSFLHAKVAVIDGRWASTVGSSNLDPLSLLLAREANVFVRRRRLRRRTARPPAARRCAHDGRADRLRRRT